MNSSIKYLFLPDISQKFLLSNPHSVLKALKNFKITFSHIVSSKDQFNTLAMKIILELESIATYKTIATRTKTLKFTFGDTRPVSKILLVQDFSQVIEYLPLLKKLPAKDFWRTETQSTELVTFPGFTPYTFFSGWERHPQIKMNFPRTHSQFSSFMKTAFFD